jgi:hypothetical protein
VPLPLPYVIDDRSDVQGNFDVISTAWPARGPHCHLARAVTAQGIPTGVATAMVWDTIIRNEYSMWTGGAGAVITVPKTGRYGIQATCEWANAAAGARGLYANLSPTTNALPINPSSLIAPAPGALVTQQSVATSVYLAAGATVQMFVWQNTGVNLNCGGAPALFFGVGTQISVSWLGE